MNQHQSKGPKIIIDKKLERFSGKVLFPGLLKKANEILKKGGLPKTKT